MPIQTRRVSIMHRLPFQKIYFSPNEGAGSAGSAGGDQASSAGSGDQASQNAAAAAATASGQESGGGKSAADLEKIIADLRKENAGHRNENKTLKEFKEKADASTQTETEKLQSQSKQATEKLTKAETDLRQERTERAIEKAARKLNIVDEEAALAFIGTKPEYKVEYDEAGKPTNMDAVLTKMVADKPYLVQQASSGGAGNPARGGEVSDDARLDAAWNKTGRGNNFGRI